MASRRDRERTRTPIARRRAVAVAARTAVAGALLAGCGSAAGGGAGGDRTSADGTGAPAASAPAAVPPALDFSAPLVGGGTFDGAELAGRPVAFWFWAPT